MLDLPKRTKDGKPYISFSQWKNFRAIKSFNLGVEGRMEYMLEYFMGYKFKGKGWGQFGKEVEAYIADREFAKNFTEKEKSILSGVKTLGVFQQYFEIDMGSFVIIGYIDDMLEDVSVIRDYKTASKNSAKQYYEDDYWQLDLYAIWVYQQTGKIPKLEVVVIERAGNCSYKGGREVLSVAGEVWEIPRETSVERMEWLKDSFTETATEISEYWTVFKNIIE